MPPARSASTASALASRIATHPVRCRPTARRRCRRGRCRAAPRSAPISGSSTGPERSSGGAANPSRPSVRLIGTRPAAHCWTIRSASRGAWPALSQAWQVPRVGMPGERQLGRRGEDADQVVGARGVGRQHERRLGQVRPAREALHLRRGQALAVEHDRDRVAQERLGAEHVDLAEGPLHGPSLPPAGSRTSPPRSRRRSATATTSADL